MIGLVNIPDNNIKVNYLIAASSGTVSETPASPRSVRSPSPDRWAQRGK